jgi:uncharacterized repeat protein (TIGR01451 family)
MLYVSLDCTDAPTPCFSSVQAAVDAAGSGDRVWIAQGEYAGASSRAGVSQVVYISKALTLRGGYSTDFSVRDPAGMPTVIDAQGKGRVIYATGQIDLTLDGLSITGGDAADMGGGPWAENAGGGIYGISATLTLDNVRVFGNTAHVGGGVYLVKGRAMLENNAIFGNTAWAYGGGICGQYGEAWLYSNVIFSNTASTGGGGVYIASAQAVLVENDIRGNLARQYGGGVLLFSSDGATVRDNLILDNDGWAYGGGIAVWRGDQVLVADNSVQNNSSGSGGGIYSRDSSALTVSGNTISSNKGTQGGGIHLFYSYYATLRGNRIQGNSASQDGGGIMLWDAHLAALEGNTILSNTAQADGGGIYHYQSHDVVVGANQIIGNVAERGGGIHISGGWQKENAALNRTVIWGNAAQNEGGGLYMRSCADTSVDNAVISDNWAGVAGSGVYISGCDSRLGHITVARNHGGDGSGIHITNEPEQSSGVALTNTILVSHTVGITVASGNTATLRATLWGSGIWANEVDWDGGGTIITGTAGHNNWGDPAFVDPGAGDYHIGLGPAVDAGIETGLLSDIDGQVRPHYDGPDLGADEWWPLQVLKTVKPGIAEPGDVVTYTLALTNVTDGATNVRVTDTMPVQVSYLGPLEYSSGDGGYAGGTITWTGAVASDTPVLITWAVQLTLDTPYSITVANSAVISDPFGVFWTERSPALIPPRCAYLPVAVRQLP